MLTEQARTTNFVHRRSLGPAVDNLPPAFWSLLDHCGMGRRICPGPEAWDMLWKLLDASATGRKPPRPPAGTEPANSLKWALVDHLLWANELDMLDKVGQLLRSLGPGDWVMKD